MKKFVTMVMALSLAACGSYAVQRPFVLVTKVMAHDDVIDDYFAQAKKGIIDIISAEPSQGEYALDLLTIAKCFARIGDHCTNIAEWEESL